MPNLRFVAFVSVLTASIASAQIPPGVLQSGRPGQSAQPILPSPPVLVHPVQQVVPSTPVQDAPATIAPQAPPELAAKVDTRNTVANTLIPEEQAEGWRLLFDGQRLIGLRGVQRTSPLSSGWVIRSGELALPKDIKNMDKVTGGDLITTDQYWDFEFRFEWKATVSADSGVRYLLSESAGQTPGGLEYQIIDDVHSSVGLKGGPLRRSGALDNVLPVGDNAKLRSADPLNKVGDPWNEGRIVVRGTHVEHWLNGDKVLEFELGPHLRQLAEANRAKVPVNFGTKARTRLCLLDQGTEVAFRNLKIRPLIPQAMVAPGTGAPKTFPQVPNPLLLPQGASAPRR